MSLLNQTLVPMLLRAAGFMLLHSLWQGVALALVVALLLRGLRGRAAVVRYRLAVVALATLIGLAVSTFGYYYQAPVGAPTQGGRAVAVARATDQRPAVAHMQPAATTRHLEQCLPVLVGAWLLGCGAMLARLLLALRYVRRLRRHRVRAVPEAWQQCLARLTHRAGLRRPVQLLVSALVLSPLVMGYFKPVILLPLSVLSQMTPAELEMILAHELAHILRKDYLFNLVQSLAETVFFYHPAVWYLSAVLHAERENCCDDLAAQLTGSPQQLARALAALAELTQYPAAAPRLTLAALGPADSLLSRVRRLANYRPAQATGLWPASLVLLGVGLLLGSALLAAHPARSRHLASTSTRHRRASTTISTPDYPTRPTHTPLAKSHDELQSIFQAQLLADGLLPDADHYTITLAKATLLVNNRPQPAAYLPKYQRLYEAATGYAFTATTAYHTENQVTVTSRLAAGAAATEHPTSGIVYELELATSASTGPGSPEATKGLTAEQARLLRQLQHDGLVTATTHQVRVEATPAGQLLVNGQPQPARLLATYRALLPPDPEVAQ